MQMAALCNEQRTKKTLPQLADGFVAAALCSHQLAKHIVKLIHILNDFNCKDSLQDKLFALLEGLLTANEFTIAKKLFHGAVLQHIATITQCSAVQCIQLTRRPHIGTVSTQPHQHSRPTQVPARLMLF